MNQTITYNCILIGRYPPLTRYIYYLFNVICHLVFSEVVYIEVLDNGTCLYNTDIPNGMMKLKFRLQSKLNYNVITVRKVFFIYSICNRHSNKFVLYRSKTTSWLKLH